MIECGPRLWRCVVMAFVVFASACGGGGGGGTSAPPPTSLYFEGMISPAKVEASILSSVVLRFGEELDPSSVTSATVALMVGDQAVETTTTVSGNLITLKPARQLMPGTTYRVKLAPEVRGLSGRAVGPVGSPDQLQFATESWPIRTETLLAFDAIGPDAPVAVGDFDGDSIADVAVARISPTRTAVLRGLGGGRFAASYDVPMNDAACRHATMRAADLDGDGRDELLIGAYSEGPDAGTCGVSVLATAPASPLLSLRAHWASRLTSVIEVTDYNGDGRKDVLGVGAAVSMYSLAVWTQQNDGAFALTAERPLFDLNGGVRMAVADLDGDGLGEVLAWADAGPMFQAQVLVRQTAPGVPGVPVALPPVLVPQAGANSWRDAELFDANGDGRLDIVASMGGNGSQAVLGSYYQDALGQFADPVTLLAADQSPQGMAVADLNQDGRQDLVVVHVGWQSISAYLPTLDGQFSSRLRYLLEMQTTGPESFKLADLNGDALPDVVFCDGQALKVLFQVPVP